VLVAGQGLQVGLWVLERKALTAATLFFPQLPLLVVVAAGQ
jgi:hypothetical protein